MPKKAEQNDIQKLMDQMKEMQDELKRLKAAAPQAQPEPKFRYGIRILKLDDGRTNIEVFGPPGEQVTVTLEELAGLARVLDERIRFWYQQQFANELAASRQAQLQAEAKESPANAQEAQAG